MQDTCVGFLLGGIGELNKNRQPNFMVVDKSNCAYTKGGVSWLHRYLIFLSFRHAIVRHWGLLEKVHQKGRHWYHSHQPERECAKTLEKCFDLRNAGDLLIFCFYTRLLSLFALPLMGTPLQFLRSWRSPQRTTLMIRLKTPFSDVPEECSIPKTCVSLQRVWDRFRCLHFLDFWVFSVILCNTYYCRIYTVRSSSFSYGFKSRLKMST